MRVSGLVNPTYVFALDGLEHDAEEAYNKLGSRGESVIALATRYLDALEKMLNNAERNQRFADADTRNGSKAS